MKILIACDQRSSADRLYFDLRRSGFPDHVEVLVLSVADVFLVPGYKKSEFTRPMNKAYLTFIDQQIEKAQVIAQHISRKLKSKFPAWHFHAQAGAGSPSLEILNKAQTWKADLIIVGSHGKVGAGEIFFGSVALDVLAQAPCSVRIVRPRAKETDSPSRLVIGVDGSSESDATIDRLTARHWKEGSATHLVTAVNSVVYSAFLSENIYVTPLVYTAQIPDGTGIKKEWKSKGNKNPKAWVKRMHEEYKTRLQKAGLIVSSMIKEGDPQTVLVAEARRWGSDCIFVGAVGHDKAERFLVGSVSSAIASRADCSVEVVRTKKNKVKAVVRKTT